MQRITSWASTTIVIKVKAKLTNTCVKSAAWTSSRSNSLAEREQLDHFASRFEASAAATVASSLHHQQPATRSANCQCEMYSSEHQQPQRAAEVFASIPVAPLCPHVSENIRHSARFHSRFQWLRWAITGWRHSHLQSSSASWVFHPPWTFTGRHIRAIGQVMIPSKMPFTLYSTTWESPGTYAGLFVDDSSVFRSIQNIRLFLQLHNSTTLLLHPNTEQRWPTRLRAKYLPLSWLPPKPSSNTATCLGVFWLASWCGTRESLSSR